mgnify:CR=1 FL=1
MRAAHVDGRADHEARRRQRHLAADLRLHPRATPLPGSSAWINGGTMERLFFPIIALASSLRRLRPGGSAPDPGAVRAATARANRQTTGGSTYMPLRVNMAGVIPVIFAAAIMALPPTIAQFVRPWTGFVNRNFQPTELGLYSRDRGHPDHRLHVTSTRRSSSTRSTRPTTCASTAGYIPASVPAADCGVSRPRAATTDTARLVVPRDRGDRAEPLHPVLRILAGDGPRARAAPRC